VEVVSGGVQRRWSAAREVVLVCGEGVGAIAVHRRRLRPRRRILHSDASSTVQRRRRLSIGDGSVSATASSTARRTIEHGAVEDSGRSARQFLRLVVLRREIFTARE
jgi:hypothetical protein